MLDSFDFLLANSMLFWLFRTDHTCPRSSKHFCMLPCMSLSILSVRLSKPQSDELIS